MLFIYFVLFSYIYLYLSFPVAQMVEHGVSNAKIMGSIPRESKSWSNVKTVTWMHVSRLDKSVC